MLHVWAVMSPAQWCRLEGAIGLAVVRMSRASGGLVANGQRCDNRRKDTRRRSDEHGFVKAIAERARTPERHLADTSQGGEHGDRDQAARARDVVVDRGGDTRMFRRSGR